MYREWHSINNVVEYLLSISNALLIIIVIVSCDAVCVICEKENLSSTVSNVKISMNHVTDEQIQCKPSILQMFCCCLIIIIWLLVLFTCMNFTTCICSFFNLMLFSCSAPECVCVCPWIKSNPSSKWYPGVNGMHYCADRLTGLWCSLSKKCILGMQACIKMSYNIPLV